MESVHFNYMFKILWGIIYNAAKGHLDCEAWRRSFGSLGQRLIHLRGMGDSESVLILCPFPNVCVRETLKEKCC